jgi:beta-glucosidase
LPADIQQAVAKLVGFDRVSLSPHQTRHITVHIDREQLSSWSAARNGWQVGPGKRTLWVGSSSRDRRLHMTVDVR